MSSRLIHHPPSVERFVYAPAEEPLPAPVPPESASERHAAEQAAWERGYAQAQAEWAAKYEHQIAELRQSLAAALEAFVQEKQRYFEAVEAEVVALALAIARKVLHREAQIDPTLLASLVHVALQKLGDTTRVRLRVHPSLFETWRQHFETSAVSSTTPELVADPMLPAGRCRIETELGFTEVGIDLHLREIEQGFFDLLPRRAEPTG